MIRGMREPANISVMESSYFAYPLIYVQQWEHGCWREIFTGATLFLHAPPVNPQRKAARAYAEAGDSLNDKTLSSSAARARDGWRQVGRACEMRWNEWPLAACVPHATANLPSPSLMAISLPIHSSEGTKPSPAPSLQVQSVCTAHSRTERSRVTKSKSL